MSSSITIFANTLVKITVCQTFSVWFTMIHVARVACIASVGACSQKSGFQNLLVILIEKLWEKT